MPNLLIKVSGVQVIAIAAAKGGDILKGALIGGLTGGLMGLTCGAAASLVATGGATAFASTGVVMGTNTMLTATGSTVMVASEVAAVNAMSAATAADKFLGTLTQHGVDRHWNLICQTVRNIWGKFDQIFVNRGLRNVVKTVPVNLQPDIIAVKDG